MNKEMQILLKVQDELINKGYNVIYIALYGSQNYSIQRPESDYDYKAIVVPSLDDIVFNRKPVSTAFEHGYGGQVDVKDIRLMIDQWIKGASNFMELLFTEYYSTPNPNYVEFISELRTKREDIAAISANLTLNSMLGMMHEKYHALDHPYPCQAQEIEEKHYAAKQLSHLIRYGGMIKFYGKVLYEVLLNPLAYNDAPELLKHYLSLSKKIKTRETEFPDLKSAQKFANGLLKECRAITNLTSKKDINTDMRRWLNDIKGAIIKRALTLELKENTK